MSRPPQSSVRRLVCFDRRYRYRPASFSVGSRLFSVVLSSIVVRSEWIVRRLLSIGWFVGIGGYWSIVVCPLGCSGRLVVVETVD